LLLTGTWARNQLFLVTPSAVVLVFAAAGGGSGRIVGLGGTADPFVEARPHYTRRCSRRSPYWEHIPPHFRPFRYANSLGVISTAMSTTTPFLVTVHLLSVHYGYRN